MQFDVIQVALFTAAMAAMGTILIAPFGTALAWMLARREWRGKVIVETLVTLPLVIPPVATGLILLKIFSRRGALGQWLEAHGLDVVFSWRGVVVATAVMSLPLLVRAARVAFEEVNPRFESVARTLGAGPARVFFRVTLPLAARGLTAGLVLAFARALGEFGATIMLAGNIPGKTATLSLSIYNLVQLGRDSEAATLLTISIVLAFGAVLVGELLLRRPKRPPASLS